MKRSVPLAVALGSLSASAIAGPPYLTDDPAPTETGHWEIYAFATGEGRHASFDGDAGVDLNYGPVKDLQLTATLPLSFNHESGTGWHTGSGDVELGTKYRFFNDEEAGFSAAVFPRVILPTSSLTDNGKARLLLPVWLQKDMGSTSVFGGGGYEINPGAGNRDFWQAALAATRQFSAGFSAGIEVARQGQDAVGGTAQTRAGVGATFKMSEHHSLLFSGGPTWADHQTSYRIYSALAFNF
ncbi:MAG TPA: hypothetical protein VFH89_07305 [Sphingomicrobium sp.]|nr:hypothetical protein [Sphingomicrobium sp.]